MQHTMSAEYRALLDAAPRIERDNAFAHSTYDGSVSLCNRRIGPNYSATGKPRCAKCRENAETTATRQQLESVAVIRRLRDAIRHGLQDRYGARRDWPANERARVEWLDVQIRNGGNGG